MGCLEGPLKSQCGGRAPRQKCTTSQRFGPVGSLTAAPCSSELQYRLAYGTPSTHNLLYTAISCQHLAPILWNFVRCRLEPSHAPASDGILKVFALQDAHKGPRGPIRAHVGPKKHFPPPPPIPKDFPASLELLGPCLATGPILNI